MANHKSAIKEHRQSIGRRARNRWHRSRLRTAVKIYRKALEAGELDRARELLQPTLAILDRSATRGVIHANAAARTKSRLTRALARQA